jgi:hypothetical protein
MWHSLFLRSTKMVLGRFANNLHICKIQTPRVEECNLNSARGKLSLKMNVTTQFSKTNWTFLVLAGKFKHYLIGFLNKNLARTDCLSLLSQRLYPGTHDLHAVKKYFLIGQINYKI